ncbi:MAG: hypothetical protein AAB658_19890 [Chloroflexota bacterium]
MIPVNVKVEMVGPLALIIRKHAGQLADERLWLVEIGPPNVNVVII